jgi:uncharacterized protein (UPF0332 family)
VSWKEVPLDKEVSERAFKQFLDLWILPEVERRRRAKLIPKNFVLNRAQVLMFADGRGNIVRLNEEVRAVVQAKATRAIRRGESVFENDISDIVGLELTDQDDPNAGHFTAILLRGVWVIVWDFRYNKGMARERANAAKEFLEVAKICFEKKLLRACVDNLFSAIELLASAQLLMIPDLKYTKKQTHNYTQTKYNAFVSVGNYKVDYKTALNKLSSLRDKARYLEQSFAINPEELGKYLEIAIDMARTTEKLIQ